MMRKNFYALNYTFSVQNLSELVPSSINSRTNLHYDYIHVFTYALSPYLSSVQQKLNGSGGFLQETLV